jgi:ABC-type sugar transport system ATPase subunit
MDKSLLKMKGITKKFPGILALDSVDFDVPKGEIRAIVGKNGAGKSTLIKILTGIYTPDSGDVMIGEKSFSHITPDVMYSEGIQAIYQENDLVPYFTVGESIMLNNEPRSSVKTFLDKKSMNEKAHAILLEKIGIDIDPKKLIRELSVSEKQLVQIAKALVKEPRIMIFDEPTAPLSAKEIGKLFEIIRALRSSGITIIYISHRFEEIFEIADSITIMRDGKKIIDLPLNETNEDEIIRHMTGGQIEVTGRGKERKTLSEEITFEVEGLHSERVHGISFTLRKGEILGLFGAEGAGQVEMVRAIYGLLPKKGRMKLGGKETRIRKPTDAIKKGIGYVPRDRKEESLVRTFTLAENVTLSHLEAFSSAGFVSKRSEQKIAENMIKDLAISTRSTRTVVNFLSGGNQQKVAIARWLTFPLKMLILDYPTMGVDVQAKVEIYRLLNKISAEGTSIIIITPEYEEIEMLCDRVMVMKDGLQRAILDVKDIDEDILLKYAIGSSESVVS